MNDLLNFARATARWWRRPRVRRVALALLALWLMDAIIGNITEKWWCDALGVGALWTARSFAQWQLFFASALLGSAFLAALIFFLTPPRESVPDINQRSVLESAVAAYAQYGRRATWQIGAIVVLWQSRRAAFWGDEWLLWRSGEAWGERDWSGADWSAWIWGWPIFDGLSRILWSSVTLALLAGFALHAVQIVLVSLRRQNENALLSARRLLWFLGALWFACLGARYFWLRAQGAIAWRGNDATVPVGWDWLSWHLTRLTDSSGIILAACGWLLCMLAIMRPASTCRTFLRPAWSAAILAWWLPGTLQVLAGGPLWRLIVAPDEATREAPFLAAYRNATQRAWQVDTQTYMVRAVPVGNLTSPESANLSRTARVWDEEALQAALGDAGERVPPTLNCDNGRLVGVTLNGVYDATRAIDGKPPLLRAFAPAVSWPAATTSETRGDIVLPGAARVLWAWRLRDFGALWRKYATLHSDWNERARALLPAARTVDTPYLTPDGWLVQNLSGTTEYLPGVLRTFNAQGQAAHLSDAAKITIAPDGTAQLWAGRDNEIWTRIWRHLAGAALQSESNAPVGTRAAKSVAQARVQVWNQLVSAENPHWSCSEIEYALLEAPENSAGARWILQGIIREQTRLAGWLEINADTENETWRVWQIAPDLPRAEPVWPLNEEALNEDSATAVRDSEVKAARVRSKVLMAPLWRGAVADSETQETDVALLLWQNQYEAPAPAWLPLRVMPMTGWRLNRMAASDATREERVAVGRSASELLDLWSRIAPAPTREQTEMLATRRAAQELSRLLEDEEKALRSGDWPKAEYLRQQQRAILDTMK